MPRTDLIVTGMHCASCVAHVEKALRRVEGVESAEVNLATSRASVEGRGVVGPSLVESVTRAGYTAELVDLNQPNGKAEDPVKPVGLLSRTTAMSRALWTLPLAIGVMALMWVDAGWSPWVQGIGCTVVMAALGTPFFMGAARGLRYGRIDMDTLVALGSGVAYAASVVHLLWPTAGVLHFGTAAAILWFITLGHALEYKARQAAASALRGLRDLAPETATVVEFGRETEKPIHDVRVGQTVLVKPGGRVPLDGEVTQGDSQIDQSMVTGESVPVDVGPGDQAYAGTINQTGSLRIKVTATGAQTLLGQIVELVEQAQTGKARVQRLADRVAGVFVPIVIVIAASSYLGWGLLGDNWSHGLTAAVAVLIIACPCALGLAVPTAILVGTGIGARRGILIKDPAALERAGNIQQIILDKTGTLTTGRPSVTDIIVHDPDLSEQDMLRLAAAVEQDSEHPLGRAILSAAEQRAIGLPPVSNFFATTSAGVAGNVEGRVVKVGRFTALREAGIEVPGGFQPLLDGHSRKARTLVAVAVDNRAVGLLALADEVRPEAADAVAALQGLGLKVVMMTGDSQFVADLVARQLKIDRALAEVKPADKRDEVIRQQTLGRAVAMVGDGINDAPALAEADIGIAIGGGTDIARDAGHVVLVGADLMNLPTAIRLGRATMRRIVAGLIWASVYNIALIPLAALGIVHPMAAAGAMSLSSVSVVLNALWLRWMWRG
ncbi:MAG: heavy metal translocating P-type ATPase [Planctomycetota bacterium]